MQTYYLCIRTIYALTRGSGGMPPDFLELGAMRLNL